MDLLVKDKLPDFIYPVGITGMVMMGISLVIYIAFYIKYASIKDINLDPGKFHNTQHEALLITFLVVGFIGYLMCLVIPYGHILKARYDVGDSINADVRHKERIVSHDENLYGVKVFGE